MDFAPLRLLFHPPRADLVAAQPVLAIKAHWRWLQARRPRGVRDEGYGTIEEATNYEVALMSQLAGGWLQARRPRGVRDERYGAREVDAELSKRRRTAKSPWCPSWLQARRPRGRAGAREGGREGDSERWGWM